MVGENAGANSYAGDSPRVPVEPVGHELTPHPPITRKRSYAKGMCGADLHWLIDLIFDDGDRRVAAIIPPLVEARRLCDQVKSDLSSAHAEICKLQGLDPATHSWPDWTPQANTLRWLEAKLIPQIDAALAEAETPNLTPQGHSHE